MKTKFLALLTLTLILFLNACSPFRLEIHLIVVNLLAGPYNVIVNDVTANFDPANDPHTGISPNVCASHRKNPGTIV